MLIRGFTRKLDQFWSIIDKYPVNIIISVWEMVRKFFEFWLKVYSAEILCKFINIREEGGFIFVFSCQLYVDNYCVSGSFEAEALQNGGSKILTICWIKGLRLTFSLLTRDRITVLSSITNVSEYCLVVWIRQRCYEYENGYRRRLHISSESACIAY